MPMNVLVQQATLATNATKVSYSFKTAFTVYVGHFGIISRK